MWEAGTASPDAIPITQAMHAFSSSGLGADRFVPSAVTVWQRSAWVGHATRQYRLENRGETFISTKRMMGRHWVRAAGGEHWTPEKVAACVLKTIRDELMMRFQAAPKQVVITVPASFGSEARRATVTAARLAGFEPDTIRLFDEPTAALLAQLQFRRGLLEQARPLRCMVVDIGGGTLDVSLVQVERDGDETRFVVQGQSRFTELAGDDFDLNIAGLLLARYEAERGELRARGVQVDAMRLLFSDLLLRAEEAKRGLSDLLRGRPFNETWASITRTVMITQTPEHEPWSTTVSGSDLGQALLEYFKFEASAEKRRDGFGFYRPLQECLDAASRVTGEAIGMEQVDRIWLAGGSAHLPVVSLAIEQWAGEAPTIVRKPMLAVALGAAWYAGILAGWQAARLTVEDRMFDGLYLELADGRFRELVRPGQAAEPFEQTFADVLEMSTAGQGIEVNVFLGTEDILTGDADLKTQRSKWTPILRGGVQFDELLPAGQPISLTVELTANRELRLEFWTQKDGVVRRGSVTVDYTADRPHGLAPSALTLPINRAWEPA